MIRVSGLQKSFDKFKALDGVEMHVGKGNIYGLVGPNGAGKSTLIRHLMGVYRADAGEILINGEAVYENREVKEKVVCIPAWRTPWTEEPGGLQSVGSQRVRHD